MAGVVRFMQREPHTGVHALLQESAVGWWAVPAQAVAAGQSPVVCHQPPQDLLEGLACG